MDTTLFTSLIGLFIHIFPQFSATIAAAIIISFSLGLLTWFLSLGLGGLMKFKK